MRPWARDDDSCRYCGEVDHRDYDCPLNDTDHFHDIRLAEYLEDRDR